MMTGSGSVVYGVFADDKAALAAQRSLCQNPGWGKVLLTHTRVEQTAL